MYVTLQRRASGTVVRTFSDAELDILVSKQLYIGISPQSGTQTQKNIHALNHIIQKLTLPIDVDYSAVSQLNKEEHLQFPIF